MLKIFNKLYILNDTQAFYVLMKKKLVFTSFFLSGVVYVLLIHLLIFVQFRILG